MEYYDKAYDRVTVKNEKKLKRINRIFHKVTTTDDPIIRQVIFILLSRSFIMYFCVLKVEVIKLSLSYYLIAGFSRRFLLLSILFFFLMRNKLKKFDGFKERITILFLWYLVLFAAETG